MNGRLFTFLEEQLRRYWNVFFLLGNHEPTGTSWPAAKATVRSFVTRPPTRTSSPTSAAILGPPRLASMPRRLSTSARDCAQMGMS
ncbi:hypothetical protein CMQ_5050 [Grosmannia clavigera kw1407]|uniref:Calcineurin-like phosphoesterase domain-containing protein n=1 Tax=Grosmannia clavigera (strain kw1407 / UAMH 11150) TaxID=655863 RepID=F0XKD4_GROCL|nr:uncharacterized protein CMQ_5050 [Grosmannia clavigera kw1407]EFX01979.1 hypothetical protein CMQ_5050 [Grosmannia clavigera kw1407]